MRKLPEVNLSPCPPDYARLVAQGWDSAQEAYALTPTPKLVGILEEAQAKARETNESNGEVIIDILGHAFKVRARGTRRYRWCLGNDDFLVFVGVPKHDWAVSVRYLAAGLWEHGWGALRERVLGVIEPLTMQQKLDFIRVTRADWCFDFYAPTLADEVRAGEVVNVVAHSSVKKIETQTVGIGERSQTLTIGVRSNVQVQLYDKTREIDEQSGKTWLYPLWVKNLGGKSPWHGRPRDVWRLEVRFFSRFLKERNCRSPSDVEASRDHLIAEALFTRRWVVPQSQDRHRQRWPMHPIWSEAYRSRGTTEMLPLGRKTTGRREILLDRALRQIGGALRSATVLCFGDYDDAKASGLLQSAYNKITADREHQKKVEAAKVRYSDVDDAR